MHKRLKSNAFSLRLAAFTLMMLLPIALFFAAQSGASSLTWLLLALVSTANLLLILAG